MEYGILTCWIQADKINTLIKAADVPDVEPIWASLFAKVCARNRDTNANHFHRETEQFD